MKEVIRYIEIAVTEACNLNCKACSHFSPLARPEDRVSLAEFVKDIRRLQNLFPAIRKIRLLGGEPLLHEDVFQMAKEVRSLYPEVEISIVTNGLLIPSIAQENLKMMQQNRIIFDISLYPPTEKIRGKIEAICSAAGINMVFTDYISTFRVRFDPTGTNDGARSYETCELGKRCVYLYRGKLSGCPAPNTIRLFNRSFGTQINGEPDMVDLRSTQLSAAEIYQKLKRPLHVCRYCADVEETPWALTCGQPATSDWVVRKAGNSRTFGSSKGKKSASIV